MPPKLLTNISQFRRPNANLYISIPTVYIMRVSFRPSYHVSRISNGILSSARHRLLYYRNASRLLARPQEGLWVYISGHMLEMKPAVKNHYQRRLRSALMEELRKRGFDKEGKRAKNGRQKWERLKNGLFGTLELSAYPQFADAKWDKVQSQVGLVVERMEKICEKMEGDE